MVFSSSVFLFLFLPLVLSLYLLAPRFLRNTLLLAASLFFYAWGEKTYVLIMLCSVAINYLAGVGLRYHRRDTVSAKWILIAAIILDLLLLGYFKYFNFLSENLNVLLRVLGVPQLTTEPVHLPIGISFFTFQAMSYVIDVYRGDAESQVNPLNNGLYVALFPQLIAGPIVRYAQIAEQIKERHLTLAGFQEGIILFVIGLGKKMLIANPLGDVADQVFTIPENNLLFSLAWLGVVSYTLQIYFDFSGYSDMALGLGKMFGFTFLVNFYYPYTALSLRDFWRRWHISLSSWFRDYVYIPLGGNKKGARRTGINLLVVFVLCGFWHGASWNFVLWGLMHGLFLALERGRLGEFLGRMRRPVRHLYVMFVVMTAWVLFRAPDLDYAGAYLLAMFGGGSGDGVVYYSSLYWNREVAVVMLVGCLGAAPILPTFRSWLTGLENQASPGEQRVLGIAVYGGKVGLLLLILLACAMHLAAGTHNPFIYFRF